MALVWSSGDGRLLAETHLLDGARLSPVGDREAHIQVVTLGGNLFGAL
jgi:hypothetical protein